MDGGEAAGVLAQASQSPCVAFAALWLYTMKQGNRVGRTHVNVNAHQDARDLTHLSSLASAWSVLMLSTNGASRGMRHR